MCKLFMMTNLTSTKINGKLLNTINTAVTAAGDNHAFGYSILSSSGKLGGERTETPKLFRALGPAPETIKAGKLDRVTISYNQFGTIETNKAKSLVAHGRFSTNERLLRSAHPFVSDDGTLALSHNGVVRDALYSVSPIKDKLVTTCDTEILLRYWEYGGIEEIEKNVSGYYAMGILDSMEGYLHVIKDDKAPLLITYCSTVDSYLISTTAEIIKYIAKEMKWKVEPCLVIKDNSHLVFDGNEVVQSSIIVPRVGYGWDKYAAAAFGERDVDYTYGVSSKKAESVTDIANGTDTAVTVVETLTMAEEYEKDEEEYQRALRDMSMDLDDNPRFNQTDPEPRYRRSSEKGVTRYTGNNTETTSTTGNYRGKHYHGGY